MAIEGIASRGFSVICVRECGLVRHATSRLDRASDSAKNAGLTAVDLN
jgi:hypothetical protein